MRFQILVLLLLSSFYLSASQYGHWRYEIPPSSPFELVEENNGLYLQFSGEITIEADLVLMRLNADEVTAHVSLAERDLAKLPYRITTKIHRAHMIHLVRSAHLSALLTPSQLQKLPIGQQNKVGRVNVKLTDLKSGGDCGIPNFFVFDYDILNFEMTEQVVEIPESGC